MTTQLYDVVAVNMRTGTVRMMAENKALEDAEAVVEMAVYRRGVTEEFCSEVPTGMYREGDIWKGSGE